MRYFGGIVALLLLAGCGISRPAWVDRSDEARFPASRFLTATGSASLSGGEARARSMAEQSAKKELAARIKSSVRSVEKTVLADTMEITAKGVKGSSTESLTQKIRETVDQTLAGVTILDHFQDRDAGVMYALAGIDLSKLKRIVVAWGQGQDADVVPLIVRAKKIVSASAALRILDEAARKVQPPPPAYYTLKALLPAFVNSAAPEYSLADLEALALGKIAGSDLQARLADNNLIVTGLAAGLAYRAKLEPARSEARRVESTSSGTATVATGQNPWTDAGGFVGVRFSLDIKSLGLAAASPLTNRLASWSIATRAQTSRVNEPKIAFAVDAQACPAEARDRLTTAASRCWAAAGWKTSPTSPHSLADGALPEGFDAGMLYRIRCEPPKAVSLGSTRLYTVRLGVHIVRTGLTPAQSSFYASGANGDPDLAGLAAVETLEHTLCEK